VKRHATTRSAADPSSERQSSERWYHQPVAWLGAGLLFASIAGCIGMVVLAARYPDDPLPVSSERLLRMPATHPNGGP